MRRLAGHLNDEQKQRLQENLKRQRELLDANAATVDRVAADAAFHMLLAEVLGNHSIFRIMSELQDRIYRVITRVFRRTPERYAASVEEHQRIADAVFGRRWRKSCGLSLRPPPTRSVDQLGVNACVDELGTQVGVRFQGGNDLVQMVDVTIRSASAISAVF